MCWPPLECLVVICVLDSSSKDLSWFGQASLFHQAHLHDLTHDICVVCFQVHMSYSLVIRGYHHCKSYCYDVFLIDVSGCVLFSQLTFFVFVFYVAIELHHPPETFANPMRRMAISRRLLHFVSTSARPGKHTVASTNLISEHRSGSIDYFFLSISFTVRRCWSDLSTSRASRLSSKSRAFTRLVNITEAWNLRVFVSY